MNKTSQSSCYCLAGIFNFTHFPVFVYAILDERGGCLYNPLQPIVQEMAQVKVGDAIVVVAGEQGGHGDDILGIVVFDGSKIAKLSLACGIVGNDVRSLHIDALTVGLGADKIDLGSL